MSRTGGGKYKEWKRVFFCIHLSTFYTFSFHIHVERFRHGSRQKKRKESGVTHPPYFLNFPV